MIRLQSTILVLVVAFSVVITGCLYPTPNNKKDFQPSPEAVAKIDEKITKKTEAALDKMIDSKVEKAVEKALPSAVADGIVKWVMDSGPYGLIGLLTVLLGKHWVDLRNERKKTVRSAEHKNQTSA